MLPNDPILALRAAQDTMAQRQYDAGQERLAATVRLVHGAKSTRTNRDGAHLFPRLIQYLPQAFRHGSIFRRATIVTIVLALSALVGASSASAPTVAARHQLARSPSTLLDATSSRRHLLAVDSAGAAGQQVAARRLVLS
jgi:hypothetical protein